MEVSKPRLKPEDVDGDMVELLAEYSLTQREIGAIMGCSDDTIQNHFHGRWQTGHDKCNASLKRRQYEIAIKGNVTMLIWLGKNRLGQTDKLTHAIGEGAEPEMSAGSREEMVGKLIGDRPATLLQ